MPDETAGGAPADPETWHSVHCFLCDEAALLDNADYQAWFALFDPALTYRVLARTTAERPASGGDIGLIDEDHDALKLRIDQLADPKLTRAENPATRTRHFFSNLSVDALADGTLTARTNILVFRSRPPAAEQALYAGERLDVLRSAEGGGFRLLSRTAILDQSVLLDGPLSVLL